MKAINKEINIYLDDPRIGRFRPNRLGHLNKRLFPQAKFTFANSSHAILREILKFRLHAHEKCGWNLEKII